MMRTGPGLSEEDRLTAEEARRVLRRSARLAGPYRRWALATVALVTVSVTCIVAGPLLVRHGIDSGIKARDDGALNAAVVAYVVVAILAYVVGRAQFLAVNQAGEGFLRILRLTVFSRLQRQSMSFFDREKAGVLVSRMTADIESMAELVQWGLLQFVQSGLLLVVSLGVLLNLSWQLTLVALLIVPLLLGASVKFQRDSNAAYLEVRERVGANLSALQEGIAAVRVIQAYSRENEQIRRFAQSNRRLYDGHMHSVRVSTWYFGLVEFAGIAASSMAVGIGGWLVHRGSVSVGTVVAFVLLLGNLFDPVQQLSQLYNTLQSATAALHKLFGIIDATPDVDERRGAVDLPGRGDLVIDDVSFRYSPETPLALENVSLRIAHGERIALVGPTGAGKSTLAKVVARLYDPTSGSVSYGGTDLRDATLSSLRERIVVVPQEGYLFSGTVRDNVRIARGGASDSDVERALSRLGLLEHFLDLPDGLETRVQERGSRLSAGERQLVALARAALVDPGVLVLDEATSNLDPGTEREVESALEHLMAGRTVIVVAHRLSTVQRADRVVVVDRARVIEEGGYEQLVARGGAFARLVSSWLASQPAVAPGPGSKPAAGRDR